MVWDECTMAHKKALEAVNRTLQDIRENNQLIGGLVVILAGGFRQTLPVIPRGTPTDEINACLKQSALWQHVKTLKLTLNMRVHLYHDPSASDFSENLLKIDEGRVISNPKGNIRLTVPNLCQLVPDLDSLINCLSKSQR